uniref:Putative secreted protein n=1 Tax=Anopheles marajoara TaxID=58244 RepID=A0A2M4C9G2_9DIPT
MRYCCCCCCCWPALSAIRCGGASANQTIVHSSGSTARCASGTVTAGRVQHTARRPTLHWGAVAVPWLLCWQRWQRWRCSDVAPFPACPPARHS